MKTTVSPDFINRKNLKSLKKQNIKIVELDVESSNNYIMKKLGRDYDFKTVKKAARMIKFYGMKLGVKIVIGLPESTKIDDINTAKNLIKLKPKIVSIIPAIVTKGSKLEKLYKENEYNPLTITQAVENCKEIVKIFNEKNIEVISIGFNEEKKDIVAGPYHESFRQLVESSLWYDAIVNKIKKLNAKVMQVEVTVNPQDINNVLGYENENITKFKELYDVDLIVTANENIKSGKSKINVTKTYEDFAKKD